MSENQNVKNTNDANTNPIDVNAKTIDEAIELGLAQLGLTRAQVDVEIISEGKRGVFGLGSEEASVRLTPIPTEAPSEATASPLDIDEPPAFDESASVEESPSAEESASQIEMEQDESESVEKVAVEYLAGLLQRMSIQAQVVTYMASELVEAGEEPPLVLDVKGKDLGILIGRRSETLQVLQYMVRLMVSKHFNRWEPVMVDVESYRVRRRRSLQKMAHTMAERAVSTHERVVLEAMLAYERRLIHLALRDHPGVRTKSIGSDDNRKVTIIPK